MSSAFTKGMLQFAWTPLLTVWGAHQLFAPGHHLATVFASDEAAALIPAESGTGVESANKDAASARAMFRLAEGSTRFLGITNIFVALACYAGADVIATDATVSRVLGAIFLLDAGFNKTSLHASGVVGKFVTWGIGVSDVAMALYFLVAPGAS